MNNYFELALPGETLLEYAASLGSDCPFFIENVPSIVSGRGEITETVKLSLKGIHIAVVWPRIAISTKEAFEEIDTSKPEKYIKDIINKPMDHWQDRLLNDFEKTAFKKHPSLQKIKETLIQAGAVYASLTGSGAAIYGLFNQSVNMQHYFPDCFVRNGILK